MTDTLIFGISEAIRADDALIEKMAAKDGYIVTDVRLAPVNSRLTIGGEQVWQGDAGVWFWLATVVASNSQVVDR